MSRLSHSAVVCVAVVSAFLVQGARAEGPVAKPGEQSAHKSAGEKSLQYLLYLPEDYGKEKDKKWPLVLFLHGSGERGADVQKVALHGPPKLAAAGKKFPFILVSPQCPEKKWWDVGALDALLAEVGKDYKVDDDRVYCTGLSMGGFGTWTMAIAHPEKFAAIAPICGGGKMEEAAKIKDVPTWVFHGDADKAVPVQLSKEMVEAMKLADAPEVKLTIYPGVGHDSWTQTYNDPKLYEWLLSHKKGEKPKAEKAEK